VALGCVRVFWRDLEARLGPAVGDVRSPSVEMLVDCSSRGILKHGTSGSLALALAMVAAAFGRELYEIVITGEITLAGVVLPVGGLNGQMQGVAEAEMTHLMLPAGNANYYYGLDGEGRRKRIPIQRPPSLHLVPVTNFLQAVDLAVAPKPGESVPLFWDPSRTRINSR
jgi:ATP-dependent Lon protease